MIRTGKERIRNLGKTLFDVGVVRFMEADLDLLPW